MHFPSISEPEIMLSPLRTGIPQRIGSGTLRSAHLYGMSHHYFTAGTSARSGIYLEDSFHRLPVPREGTYKGGLTGPGRRRKIEPEDFSGRNLRGRMQHLGDSRHKVFLVAVGRRYHGVGGFADLFQRTGPSDHHVMRHPVGVPEKQRSQN